MAINSIDKKIDFLLKNKHLADRKIAEFGPDIVVKPCCFGTVVYLLGLNDAVKKAWIDYNRGWKGWDAVCGNSVMIDCDHLPGYVGRKPLELVLPQLKQCGREKGAMVLYYWAEGGKVSERQPILQHAGVYVDRDPSKQMFHQVGLGWQWEWAKVDNIAECLPEEERETLDVKYYKI